MNAKTAEQQNAANFDLGAVLKDQITAANKILMSGVTAGAEGVWIKVGPAVRALEHHYKLAQQDEQARIPTLLSVAIEAVLRQCAPATDPYAERREPTWRDGDMSVDARPLPRPGR